jgi:acyl-coenzyme A synthetase/AMP-(fatty) acid ligase
VVVLKPSCSLTLAELQGAVRLAPVKQPRQLVVVDSFPRTALGKVQKAVVKATVTAQPPLSQP